jgi:hypothetical protein
MAQTSMQNRFSFVDRCRRSEVKKACHMVIYMAPIQDSVRVGAEHTLMLVKVYR